MDSQASSEQQDKQQPTDTNLTDTAPDPLLQPDPAATPDPVEDVVSRETLDPAATPDPVEDVVSRETLSEELAALRSEVHTMRVTALGMLADPADLPYSPDLNTPEALQAAAQALVEAKPHLRARRAGGDVGQHVESAGQGLGVSLAELLRAGA